MDTERNVMVQITKCGQVVSAVASGWEGYEFKVKPRAGHIAGKTPSVHPAVNGDLVCLNQGKSRQRRKD